jgi:hypothetical protein
MVAAVVLYVGDAFFMGQGVWATLPSLVMILGLLVRAAASDRHRRASIAATLAVWFMVPVVTIATIYANNALARHRADALIVAVEAYRAKHGDYPRALEDLVPEQIASVPRAKYTVAFGEFDYANLEGSASLMYTTLPPFGRPYYQFNEHRWGYLD